MERKEAIDYLLYMKHNVFANSPYDVALDTAIEALKSEPVRYANAIYMPNSKGYPSCSCCHEEMPFFLNFCPNCGARMGADHIADVSKKVGGADNGS